MTALGDTAARVLALRREAGSPDADEARRIVTRHLSALGYLVSHQSFRFHPSALLGLPILGAGVGLSAVLALPLLTLVGVPPWGALAVWTSCLAASLVLAAGVALGWLGLGRTREDANLIAVRPGATVRRWIVAHLDTKAQGHSMAGRLVTVWVIGVAIAVAAGASVSRLRGPVPLWAGAVPTVLSLVAGALAGRGRLRGTSQGARDNGSGVVAALALAEDVADHGTGFLITGAEEFGLVGARVFAEVEGSRLAGVEVVNLDTLDDEGSLYLVSHDRRGAALARATAPRVAGLGMEVRCRRLPLGILVDSLPFARGGAAAITVGRLTWRTLAVIHTPGDTPERLSLEAAERIGRALAVN